MNARHKTIACRAIVAVTTAVFAAICWWVVGNTIYRYPQNSLIGFGFLLAGSPAYWYWSRKVRHSR